MAGTRITPRDLKEKLELSTSQSHKFTYHTFRGTVLEVEDVHFHHDSAVFLPDYRDEDSTSGTLPRESTPGLELLAVCYLHAKKNPLQKFLIAGHTDTTGTPKYNDQLSQMRADNILHILTGKREDWVASVLKKNKVEDYQQILKWVNRSRKWDCDPGRIDNKDGPKTKRGVKRFQHNYNAEFGTSIPETGVVTDKTWSAFFDLYMLELKRILATDDNGMSAFRTGLHFLDGGKKTVGCGENFPIEAKRKDEYRSRINRRVELLFFDPGEEPGLECHPAVDSCIAKKCEIYDEKMYRFHAVPLLMIMSVDDHFAPSLESLGVKYRISGLKDNAVKFQILADKYSGNKLFERDLTVEEKANGLGKEITWDGKITIGPSAGEFASPPLGPFKAKLTSEGSVGGEKSFKILVHSLELRLGDFERGVFENDESSVSGQQERLKVLGYYHGDIDGQANEAKFKKSVEWFQSEHDPKAPSKGTVGDSTRKAIGTQLPFVIESGTLSGPVKKKIFVSGAFFYKQNSDLDPGGHPRFVAEKDFWGDSIKIPVYVKILLKKKNNDRGDAPKAVGKQKVLFEWIDVAYAAVLMGKQKDYISKALDYYKDTTHPKGDNCHKDRGGKRGDDITKVFPANGDTTKFPFEVVKSSSRDSAVVSTALDKNDANRGFAGVIFQPSRMGGEGYQIRAYLHTEKDLDADKDSLPDVEVKTAEMLTWRRVRVNQYLHKPHASINAINMATVNREMAKAHMEFVGSLGRVNIRRADWTARVTAALTSDADFATIGHVDYASANTIDFKSYATYHAAGGPLNAAAYTNLCRGKVWPWVERIINEFAKNQFHGMTVLRVGNAHASFVTNSGVGFAGGVCYIWWPKASYDNLGYVVEKYALHEMGHCLYLRHHYTQPASGPVGGWPASDNPDDHDADDAACAMSYYQTAWHLCGQCILKLQGWDEAVLSKDDDANKKP